MPAAWQRLSARERRTVALGAVAAVLLLGYLLVWLPLADARATLRRQVAETTVELEWMRAAVPAIATRADDAPAAAPADGRSLLARVDAAAREAALGDALLRVEPLGPDEVRVAFQSVDFDALMRWLEAFSTSQSVAVTELSAQRAAGVGLVDARLALRQAPR